MNNILKTAFISTLLSLVSNLFAQGALTPDIATPTPTMKSLQEIYDRTDDAANAVAREGTEITSLPITISDDGYYYLTQDLVLDTAGVSAITITADRAVVDLRGYTISSTANVNRRCIEVATTAQGTHIKVINGTILGNTTPANFASPRVDSEEGGFDNGITMNINFRGHIELNNLHVSRCGLVGAAVVRGRVLNCSFTYNNGTGLLAYDSTVYDCFSSDNVDNYSFDGSGLYRCLSKSASGIGYDRSGNARVSLLTECISIDDSTDVSGQGGLLVENGNNF